MQRAEGFQRIFKKPDMGSHLAFFNSILSSEKFRIPASFVRKMQGNLGNKAILIRDVYENLWELEVLRDGDTCCLSDGWAQFYRDNSLEMGDFMIFEYKGDQLFDFKIIGSNACEKEGVGAPNFGVKHEVYEYEVMDDDDCDDVRTLMSSHDDDDDDGGYDDDDDYDGGDYVEGVATPCASDINFSTCNTSCEGYMKMEADGSDEELSVSKKARTKSEPESSRAHSNRGKTVGIKTIPSKRIYKKKDLPDCYGADIFRSGLASPPKNPYFVSRSRIERRKNELYIPKDVIVDYNLDIPEKIFLVDKQGNKWATKIKQWKDGRLWCTGGWKSLCNVNGINDEDTCICEFVGEEGGNDYSLLVLVVRDYGLDK